MSKQEEVEVRLQSVPEREFCGGAADADVRQAESHFEGRFPADYVAFLKSLGCGYASSEEFIGLGGKPHLDVIRLAMDLRQPSAHARLPRYLVPLRGDGFGNYDCIDLSASDLSQSHIVTWAHGAGDEQELRPFVVGYWDWFADVLDMIEDAHE